ncbi:MAG: LptF/LptG family permease, partial [Bacteroidia bacterium]|nr:LptF/LptG family permease [Bacteroidia bacterium]
MRIPGLKRLDVYIIKKFLGTFFYSIILIISIAIIFDFAERMDDFIDGKAPFKSIIFDYYLNFIPYFTNLFSYLFVFISVIFFTSKMAQDTEIIAILSSGVSFKRFMRPYLISAGVITILSLGLANFVIPHATKKKLEFEYKYIRNAFRNDQDHIHKQIEPGIFVYLESYSVETDMAYKFSIEKFENGK